MSYPHHHSSLDLRCRLRLLEPAAGSLGRDMPLDKSASARTEVLAVAALAYGGLVDVLGEGFGSLHPIAHIGFRDASE